MASYANLTDLQSRYPARRLIELTDNSDNPTGAIDTAIIGREAEDTDALIDGYVGRYYKRIDATAPIPALLVPIACAIIYYRLWKNSSPTDQVKADYDDAIARLKDIATGKITLDQGEEKLPERDGQILVESSERLFTRNALRGA